jgi:hypothetical protein
MYPTADEPSEDFFELQDPLQQLRERRPIDIEALPPLRLPLVPEQNPPGDAELPVPPQQ